MPGGGGESINECLTFSIAQQLGDTLGKGAFGTVYRGLDVGTASVEPNYYFISSILLFSYATPIFFPFF